MDEEQIPEGLHWNKPHFYEGAQCFIPKVFEGVFEGSHEIPQGFNTALIQMEGGMRASLEWKEQSEKAQRLIQAGFKILWEINLGLSDGLHYPYGNAMQHQALGLALEHFRETLWTPFRSSSLGLVLYRGDADYSHHFAWDDQQRANYLKWAEGRKDEENLLKPLYCARVAVDYMRLLTMHLPDALRLFALLDCSDVQDPLLLGQLISRERYDPIHLVLKDAPFADQELAWQEGSSVWGYVGQKLLSTEPGNARVAVVLPALEESLSLQLRCAIQNLQFEKVPFRIIPESMLTTEWDELDQLIYCGKTLTPQGKRKLQGFSAAGGLIFDCTK
ncbi:MAG: hypothetical protein LLG04_10840 [Parachlamydia sp.]|nr:hypothetical protein [Parachlamydia sp.]